MASGLERRTKRGIRSAQFEFRRPVPAAEVGQGDRVLHVQPPVDRAHEHLADVVDDRRAARRSERHPHLPRRAVEHDQRRHRRAGTLARLHTVGDRSTIRRARREREVGELVVEQEPPHHLPRPERILDRRRHRQRVAETVHHRDVRGGRALEVDGRVCGLRAPRWDARHGASDRSVPEQRRALPDVPTIDKAGHRHVHEARVADVGVAVSKGEASGIGVQVDGLGRE